VILLIAYKTVPKTSFLTFVLENNLNLEQEVNKEVT